jgi:sugar phosphate isomerase/epimerase
VKIGIQTRPWGPELNQKHLTDVLADVAGTGYDGFEIGAQHLDIARPEILLPWRRIGGNLPIFRKSLTIRPRLCFTVPTP